MATLAESFLADLDDLDNESGAEEELEDQVKAEDEADPVSTVPAILLTHRLVCSRPQRH